MSSHVKTASAISAAVLAATLISEPSYAAPPVVDRPAGLPQTDPASQQAFSPAVRELLLDQSKDIASKTKAGNALGDCFADSDVKGFKDKGGFANFNGRDRMRAQKANPAINVQKQLKQNQYR